MSTTMGFATLLRKLMKIPEFGKRVVPLVTDEACTFGLNSFFTSSRSTPPSASTTRPWTTTS